MLLSMIIQPFKNERILKNVNKTYYTDIFFIDRNYQKQTCSPFQILSFDVSMNTKTLGIHEETTSTVFLQHCCLRNVSSAAELTQRNIISYT